MPTTEHDYAAHDALHHLTRAEEIKRDPKLMASVAKLAAEKKESMARVARMGPKTTKSSNSSKRK